MVRQHVQELIKIDQQIILASSSSARAALLSNAGFEFDTRPSGIDESAVHDLLVGKNGELEPADIAELLARTKAEVVSAENPEALVIGADQTLSTSDRVYQKCSTMEEARETLLELRGKMHHLNSAICVAERGAVVWSFCDRASLTMRNFSPEFLGRYLGIAGPDILKSVGAYQLEGPGIHLFDRIQGNYFTILGLPLLPLLKFFRKRTGNNT